MARRDGGGDYEFQANFPSAAHVEKFLWRVAAKSDLAVTGWERGQPVPGGLTVNVRDRFGTGMDLAEIRVAPSGTEVWAQGLYDGGGKKSAYKAMQFVAYAARHNSGNVAKDQRPGFWEVYMGW